jgi:predicted SnoaL-like aldol condensation-catalyzing enzyme
VRKAVRHLGLVVSSIALLALAACGGQAVAKHNGSWHTVAAEDSAQHLTQAQEIQLVRNFYQVVFNEHRLSEAGRFIRMDYIQHTPSVPQGMSGFKYFYGSIFFKDFPDVRVTIDHIITAGNRVQSFATWRGIQAKTGKKLVLHSADIYRVQDGKLAEHWDTIDFSALEPFGFAPAQADEPTSPVVTDGSPAAAANVTLLRHFWKTIFDRHDISAVPDFYSTASFREYITPMCPSVAAFEACFGLYSKVFPDLHVTPTAVIANANWVVAFLTWRGHRAGTGTPLFLHCADLYRVQNGRFTQHWSIMDFSTIEQFGIVPPASYLR